MLLVATILLLHMNCKDYGVAPPAPNWEPLGLEGKLVSELKLINDYLYACAGRDGLYRHNITNGNMRWEYLGLADTAVERTLESGVTDVLSLDDNLLVSYTAGDLLQKRGVYRSTDAGVTWLASDSGMISTPEHPVTSQVIRLLQLPSTPSVIFAGTTTSLVYASDNSGRSWTAVYGTVHAGAINYAIRFNQRTANEIWVGGETGRFAPYLLHSTNLGQTWVGPIWFPPNIGPYTYDNAVYDIAIHPTNDSVLYFGMLGVIVKTTDKARTFQRILGWEDGIYRHWRLAMNPSNAQEILVTGFYLYRTVDGGNTWQKIRPPFYEIYALAVDWQQRVLYVSVSSPENGVYKLRF